MQDRVTRRNEICHYLGAYLEIKVKEITVTKSYIGCDKGHKSNGNFCPKCGLPLKEITKKTSQYIWDIYDLLPEKMADNLAIITPHYLFKTGVIIARGNLSNRKDGQWLYLHRFSSEDISSFPNPDNLIDELSQEYAKEIEMLRSHETVESVIVKAGYVEDSEFS